MLLDPIEIPLSPNFFFARAEQFEGRFVGAELFFWLGSNLMANFLTFS